MCVSQLCNKNLINFHSCVFNFYEHDFHITCRQCHSDKNRILNDSNLLSRKDSIRNLITIFSLSFLTYTFRRKKNLSHQKIKVKKLNVLKYIVFLWLCQEIFLGLLNSNQYLTTLKNIAQLNMLSKA